METHSIFRAVRAAARNNTTIILFISFTSHVSSLSLAISSGVAANPGGSNEKSSF